MEIFNFKFQAGDIVVKGNKRWQIQQTCQRPNYFNPEVTDAEYIVKGVTKAGKVSKLTYVLDAKREDIKKVSG